MAYLSIPQIAAAWEAGGGPHAARYNAVAVALAESSGNSDAVGYNPGSTDSGLWQINSVHETFFGERWPRRFEPEINAEMAVSVSSGGQNWGPWATAYTDINAEGWKSWLSYLEPGSPAAGHLYEVEAALNENPPPPGPNPGGGCGPHDIGIPNQAIEGLQPGGSVDTVTCPGGSFPASALRSDLQVCWNQNGAVFCVTSADGNYQIPGGINVAVRRLGGSAPPVPPRPPAQPPPQPPPGGGRTDCAPDEIGIPDGIVARLGPGQSLQTVTCPGGPFDAGGLQAGLRIFGFQGGFPFTVTNADHGFMVHASIVVTVSRFGSAPPGQPQQPNQPVPPLAPFPVGDPPSGAGREQLQSVWHGNERNLNLYLPDVLERLTNVRAKLQGG